MSHLHHKVSALIDGELQGAARRRAIAHARSCPECQRELEQTYALKQRLLGLAAAEPPADLFAALGSVDAAPVNDHHGASRVTVARRALVGAGSVSLAVVTLAYVVGGAEPTSAAVKPPVKEFSAEFAGSTGLAPLSDPAVEALANDSAGADASSVASTGMATKVGSSAVASGDQPMAVRWLRRAADAPSRFAYTGTRQVVWSGSSGDSAVTLEVAHTPRQGTSYRVADDQNHLPATFIATSEAADDGELGPQPADLLIHAYDVSVAGEQDVDGRPATVVIAGRDGVPAAQFWIDNATGLLLKREMFQDGQVIRRSELTDVQTSPTGFMAHLPPALEAPAATRLSTEFAPALTDKGWACPPKLPSEFSLTLLHRLQGPHDVMHAAYSDGLSTVSIFEERGALDASSLQSFDHVTSDGSSVWVQTGLPTIVVWQAEDTIYTMVTDAPSSTTAELVASLPHQADSATDSSRLGRGLTRIGSYFDPGS